MRKRLGLVLVFAALVACALILHRLAGYFPLSSLRSGPLELALGALARLLGLVIAYWLLGTGIFLVLARMSAIPSAIRAISWLTWRPFRRLIEGSLTSSLVLALSSAPAAAAVSPEYVPVPAGDPTTTHPTTTTSMTIPTTTIRPPVTITIAEPVDTLYLPVEVFPRTGALTTLDQTEVTVRPGDSMWLLAERRLRELQGDGVTDGDVAPYWLAVIAANRDRIRSGDPDLIFPGEVLILPHWG